MATSGMLLPCDLFCIPCGSLSREGAREKLGQGTIVGDLSPALGFTLRRKDAKAQRKFSSFASWRLSVLA